MLERLTIEGFQAHSFLVINLDPAVTTIVGPSDAGKSTVVRALIWLATNRPLGDAFIRDGDKKARVTLTVDGREIVRTRGKSINTYSIDGEELKAFGNDVPEEIANLLNITDINLQHQHDSPFWFSDTAGEVSRQLNQIVDLSIIDRTLANLEKTHRATAAEVRTLEQQEEQAKDERSALSWARRAQGDLDKLEKREGRWKSATETHRNATERVEAVRLHRGAVAQLKSGEEAAEKTLATGTQWEEAWRQVSLLQGLIQEGEESAEIQHKAEAAEEVLSKGTQWEEVLGQHSLLGSLIHEARQHQAKQQQPVPDLMELERLEEIATEVSERKLCLQNIITTARSAQQRVKTTAAEAKEVEDEFKEQMGEVCALCDRPL